MDVVVFKFDKPTSNLSGFKKQAVLYQNTHLISNSEGLYF